MAQRPETESPDASGNWRNRLFNSPGMDDARVDGAEPRPQSVRPNPSNPVPRAVPDRPVAAIGATLTIKGDVAAHEDLIVKGAIQGNIVVKEHQVQIDEPGRLDGNVLAKHVTIRGQARGDVKGLEKVSILSTGRLEGTITADRVVLEDGGWFKGLIDMTPQENMDQANTQDPVRKPNKGIDRKEAPAGAPSKAVKS